MHPAATVLLLREGASGLEVLMMRRASAVAFMGGMWVFPGGRLDPADSSSDALALVLDAGGNVAEPLSSMAGETVSGHLATGLRVAACREAFEEAGVLVAVTPGGDHCEPERLARLQPRREAIVKDAGAFLRMLEEEGLRLDLGRLVYWSHWITPSLEPKRFDTRFFVARVPASQDASPDLSELTEHAWINPAGVAGAIELGELRVVPPTLLTLEDLAESYALHGSLDAMLAAERGRVVPPVMPKIEARGSTVRVVMPWDPGYAQVEGESCGGGPETYPGHFTRRRSSIEVTVPRAVRP